ncbi:MAG: hypothetical protein HOV81_00530 [Kofleriaceae bacterium]|nr:hypothetical protein [Kofleriaceae bacterium]
MRGVLCVALVVTGCGRIGFDAASGDAGGDAYAGCPVVAAAAGQQHTCAIDARGDVWCWGYNDRGQVLPSAPLYVPSPIKVPLPSAAVQLAGGRSSTCARLTDGSVNCWGENSKFELGNGTQTFNGGPSPVMLGGDTAVDLAGGRHSYCITRASDRAIACWGDGTNFQTLQTSEADLMSATVLPSTAGTQSFVMGHRTACRIDNANKATCWGRNYNGQLGTPGGNLQMTPTSIPNVGAVRQVAMAGQSSCVVEDTGDVRCFGSNYFGQLGLSDLAYHDGVNGAAVANAVDVSVATYGACARLADGRLSCWGDVAPGLGPLSPVPTATSLTNLTALTSGGFHMCGIQDGALLCWGSNLFGQLGRGARSASIQPRAVTLAGSPTKIALGDSHGCALSGNTLQCWGANDHGQLGDGTLASTAAPVTVDTGLATIDGITTGDAHTCAWGGGTLRCWGSAAGGRIGIDPPADDRQRMPITVPGLGTVSAAGAGAAQTCALAGTTVRCAGSNFFGQLGDGTTNLSTSPVTVLNLIAPSKLAVGSHHACVIDNVFVKCWGDNRLGQLGDGTTMQRNAPVTVALPGSPAEIFAGPYNTCAINTLGELYCWGAGGTGQLGQGDQVDHTSPVKVPLPGNVAAVSIGGASMCARLTTNAVYCWGEAGGGLVGHGRGEADEEEVPVEIAELAGSTAVARSYFGTCAIKDGALSCFGESRLAGDQATYAADETPTPAAIPSCP